MKVDKYYIPRNYFVFPGILKTVGKLSGREGMDMIVDKCCIVLQIEKEEILKKTNIAENVKAGQLIMWCISKKTTCTLMEIGKYFDKEHSTILHSIRKINNLIDIKTIEGENAKELLAQL